MTACEQVLLDLLTNCQGGSELKPTIIPPSSSSTASLSSISICGGKKIKSSGGRYLPSSILALTNYGKFAKPDVKDSARLPLSQTDSTKQKNPDQSTLLRPPLFPQITTRTQNSPPILSSLNQKSSSNFKIEPSFPLLALLK